MLVHNNQKILIVASSFAPSSAVGAKRFTFLSLFFEKRCGGLNILTRKEKYFPSIDNSLPIAGNVYRVGMYPDFPIKPNHFIGKVYNKLWREYFCLVDPFSGWIIPSIYSGIKIVKKNQIDIIIATCPMFSSIVAGFIISCITKTKLILDYRDPWSTHNHKFCKIFGRKIGRYFEKLAAKRATTIVFVTKIMRDQFKKSLGKFTKANLHVVPSGFYNRDKIKPLSLGYNKKNMIYAGTLYGERRIKLLAKPLYRLLENGLINHKNFCFHMFGELNDNDKKIIDKYGLQELIERHSSVNYELILRYMKGADILFLPSGSNVSYAIPFKLYDYLSVKKPILALTAETSAVAEIMREIDCGRVAPIDNEDLITEKLGTMILEKRKYTFAGSEKYLWKNIAKKYLKIINQI